MAMLLRCFTDPKPPISIPSSSFNLHSSAPSSQRRCRENDHVSISSLNVFPTKCKTLSHGNFVYAKQTDHWIASRKTYLALSDFQDLIPKYFSNHQNVLSLYTKVLAIANSVLFALPSHAFAETCEADSSLFSMPLLFGIAMIGATVGGLLARQRKGELKKLNDQLRQINAALRRQAKIELSYAPVGASMAELEVVVDPRIEDLVSNLRAGKSYLRNQDPERAFPEFMAALQLAQTLGDHVKEKKAARGLGASLQRQGKYKEAIKYHSMVLDISKKSGNDSGVTEAYGAIADCYTEAGELEQAGKFYDKYIAGLEKE